MDITNELALQLSRTISDIQVANGRYWMQGNGMLVRVEEVLDGGVAVVYECDDDYQDLLPFNITLKALVQTFTRTAPPSVLAALARMTRLRPNHIEEEKLDEVDPLFSPYELSRSEKETAHFLAELKIPVNVNPKDRLDVVMDGYLSQITGDILVQANSGPLQAIALGYAVISSVINHTPYRLAVRLKVESNGFYAIVFYRIGSYHNDYPITLQATLKRYTGELFDY